MTAARTRGRSPTTTVTDDCSVRDAQEDGYQRKVHRARRRPAATSGTYETGAEPSRNRDTPASRRGRRHASDHGGTTRRRHGWRGTRTKECGREARDARWCRLRRPNHPRRASQATWPRGRGDRDGQLSPVGQANGERRGSETRAASRNDHAEDRGRRASSGPLSSGWRWRRSGHTTKSQPRAQLRRAVTTPAM